MHSFCFPARRTGSTSGRLQARRRRPVVESLEGRQLLTTFLVSNVNDSGTGSLRQAILGSNAATGPNSITFNIPGSGIQFIQLKSALPTLTKPVTMDGTTEPGSGGQPVIRIDGLGAGSGAVGLTVASTASGSTLKGLQVTRFGGGGGIVNGASHVSITTDLIGVAPQLGAVIVGGNGFGVELVNGANHNPLSGDVVSGNGGEGVL